MRQISHFTRQVSQWEAGDGWDEGMGQEGVGMGEFLVMEEVGRGRWWLGLPQAGCCVYSIGLAASLGRVYLELGCKHCRGAFSKVVTHPEYLFHSLFLDTQNEATVTFRHHLLGDSSPR